jgi:hypothetical protein
MGASYSSRVFPDMPESELAKKIEAAMADDAYEDGHLYSGSWGVKSGFYFVRDRGSLHNAVKTFDSVQAADDYISEENDKFGGLTVVRARIVEMKLPDGKIASTANDWSSVQVPMGKAVAAAHEKAKAANTALNQFGPDIIKRVRSAKSKTRGCGKCGSSIATTHIQSLNCPVCRHEYLVTDTDRAKQKALTEKYEKLDKAAKEARDAELKKLAEKHGKFVWVVGGWCSS